MGAEDFEEDSEIQCHNACIVTKSFVTIEDISEYLKDALINKKFKKHACIKTYSGAHGLSDGELSHRDEITMAFYSN